MDSRKKPAPGLQSKVVIWVNSEMQNKSGVVMGDDYLYNGRICCKIISGSEIFYVEAEKLQVIDIDN